MIYRGLIIPTLSIMAAMSAGCGSTPSSNSANASINANANTNTMVTIDPANLPPGLSTSPLPMSNATTPGIPANVVNMPKGATPTPGIPSEAERRKPMKPGVTPTPGIPSPEELRRQMGMPNNGAPPPATGSDVPMMKKNTNKTPNRPNKH